MSCNSAKTKPVPLTRTIPNLPSKIGPKIDEKRTLNEFREAMKDINLKRSATKNAYEKVIQALEEVVEELFRKNDCLTQEKSFLIRQNFDLRKQAESLSNIIEVKKRLGESIIVDNSEIFEILVESNSVERGFSKYEEDSYECSNTIGNILEENSNIANRQEFIIMSNPLSQNISQNDQNEISMSNIGRNQTLNHASVQTPGLHRENIFIQCNNRHPDGVIRSFYLSVMQKRSTSRHLIEIIESLKNDITTILFDPYPANEFWVELLCNFLKIAHEGQFETQLELLEYIKVHKFLDTLMIRCLKSRIQFLFYNNDSFEMPTVQQILRALANQFGLRMEVLESQFVFYTKEIKDENLLSSDRASLEISLNNKTQNVFYVREEDPCFNIVQRQDSLQITFFLLVEAELGISHYQINQDSLGRNEAFKCSGSKNGSIHLGENQLELSIRGDHLDAVASILNQRDLNSMENSGQKQVRPFGHRRYGCKENQEPLNSSRFFLNRVTSKHSSLEDS